MTMDDSDYGAAALRAALGEPVPDEEWERLRTRYEQTNPGRLAWAGRLLTDHENRKAAGTSGNPSRPAPGTNPDDAASA